MVHLLFGAAGGEERCDLRYTYLSRKLGSRDRTLKRAQRHVFVVPFCLLAGVHSCNGRRLRLSPSPLDRRTDPAAIDHRPVSPPATPAPPPPDPAADPAPASPRLAPHRSRAPDIIPASAAALRLRRLLCVLLECWCGCSSSAEHLLFSFSMACTPIPLLLGGFGATNARCLHLFWFGATAPSLTCSRMGG